MVKQPLWAAAIAHHRCMASHLANDLSLRFLCLQKIQKVTKSGIKYPELASQYTLPNRNKSFFSSANDSSNEISGSSADSSGSAFCSMLGLTSKHLQKHVRWTLESHDHYGRTWLKKDVSVYLHKQVRGWVGLEVDYEQLHLTLISCVRSIVWRSAGTERSILLDVQKKNTSCLWSTKNFLYNCWQRQSKEDLSTLYSNAFFILKLLWTISDLQNRRCMISSNDIVTINNSKLLGYL